MYVAPGSLGEALGVLARLGSRARPIAGGTDLLVELARGVRSGVEVLVDLTWIPGLDGITVDGGAARLGPLVTHGQVVGSALLVDRALPLAQACLEVGAPPLRNRATVAGNLVTASPANDTISALMALDASVRVRSVRGSRSLRVAELYTGLRQTVLEPDELVTAVEVPLLGEGERGVFVKLGLRRAQAISVVHLAIVVGFDGPRVDRVRLALGSVAPRVILVPGVHEALRGRRLDSAAIEVAVEAATAAATPIDDLRASASYRKLTVGVMVRRALEALRDGSERASWPPRPPLLRGAGPPRSRASGATRSVTAGDEIGCTVNGVAARGRGAVGHTLLEWLRDHARGLDGEVFTGTKEGCAEGECGACTVHLEGMAVLSCMVPAARAAGAQVTTVEGLADPGGRLHPVQQAFIDCAAVQCGYCIPGFLMAGAKLLEQGAGLARSDVEAGLAGNLCRCTGYYRIIDAVVRAAEREHPGEGAS